MLKASGEGIQNRVYKIMQQTGLHLLLIGLGGALGSVSRWSLSSWLSAHVNTLFPVGTLTVNVLGSFLFGIAAVLFLKWPLVPVGVRLFVLTGFLGAFTTFSTFSYEVWHLWQEGNVALSVSNMLLNLILSVGALGAGAILCSQFN